MANFNFAGGFFPLRRTYTSKAPAFTLSQTGSSFMQVQGCRLHTCKTRTAAAFKETIPCAHTVRPSAVNCESCSRGLIVHHTHRALDISAVYAYYIQR